MVRIDFTKPSFLSEHGTVKVKDTHKIPGDEFIWYDTWERGGEIWLTDPRTGRRFKKVVYSPGLQIEFHIEKNQLQKLIQEYGGKDELYLAIANKQVRVRIRND